MVIRETALQLEEVVPRGPRVGEASVPLCVSEQRSETLSRSGGRLVPSWSHKLRGDELVLRLRAVEQRSSTRATYIQVFIRPPPSALRVQMMSS